MFGVHVCRGNWSRKGEVLLEGPYDGLIPHLAKMKVNQFALEYASAPRAGSLAVLAGLPETASIGLGAVNPRTSEIESDAWIVGRARETAALLGDRRVFLNPDCGFGTFADRPMASAEVA